MKLRSVVGKLLRYGVYPARHPLIKGLWCRECSWFIQPYVDTKREVEFWLKQDLSGLVIYDVGANTGIFTLHFARAVGPDGAVVAFEPNPMTYRRLVNNLNVNRFTWVTPLQLALGNVAETKQLIIPGAHSVASFVEAHVRNWQQKTGDSPMNYVDVEVAPLDFVVSQRQLRPPHLVKIDVEGYEYEVLMGAAQTIAQYKPRLFIEIHELNLKDRTAYLKRILQFLQDHAYIIIHVEQDTIVPLEFPIGLDTWPFEIKRCHLYCYH